MLRRQPGGMIFGQLFFDFEDMFEQLGGLVNLLICYVSNSEHML